VRQRHALIPTLREVPADAETASHRLMLKAGLIRQLAAGVYSFLPLGHRVLRKVQDIVREEMERAGAQELLLPALHPAELWRQTGRWDVYGPELMRLEDRHGRAFALGATHEEAVTALVRDEIHSYKKLPVILFQIQTKFRDERRPRFGMLRAREFVMKDAYSFDTSPDGLDESYRRMYDAYRTIFSRCGLRFRIVEADSGAIGGTDSHEFIALSDIGEDTIVSCETCEYAANIEKAAIPDAVSDPSGHPVDDMPLDGSNIRCPRCGGRVRFDKGIEVGHVFKLGTRYSHAMGATFLDESGKEQPLVMGCYGIGISRLVAAIIEQHHDANGIVWPASVAPFHIHLIAVNVKDTAQAELAESIYSELTRAGYEVLYDDRNERAGVKFADADLLGLPLRITIGKLASERLAECKTRRDSAAELVAADRLLEYANQTLRGGKTV